MDLNSLNSIVSNIRSIENDMDSIDLTNVFEYGVKKHNETISILREIYTFIENNFDVFENPRGGWQSRSRNKEYHTNFNIGTANCYNCVIRDMGHESKYRTYWVDGGIIFRWNPTQNRVAYLTDLDEATPHGYGNEAKKWNDTLDFLRFNFGIGYGIEGWSEYNGTSVDWERNLWTIDTIPNKHLWNEFSITDFRNKIEEDFKHAERVMDRFIFTLKQINESVIARQTEINNTLDRSLCGTTTKYTIEITKTED